MEGVDDSSKYRQPYRGVDINPKGHFTPHDDHRQATQQHCPNTVGPRQYPQLPVPFYTEGFK
jgi:hypothetical protein